MLRSTTLLDRTLLALALFLLASGSSARAQFELGGRLHLALQAAPLTHTKFTIALDDSDSETTSRETAVGFPGAGLGGQVSYLLTGALELGAYVALTHHSYDTTGDGSSEGTYAFAAQLHYIANGRRARLFVGPFLGAFVSDSADPDEDGGADVDVRSRAASFGIDLGLYAFLLESVSIDPSLSLGYFVGSVSAHNNGGNASGRLTGFQISLNLGLSAWLPLR